jgi:fatty acid desaturase
MSATTPISSPDNIQHESQLVFWLRFLAFPALAILLYPPFVMGYGGSSPFVRMAWVILLTYCWFCVGGAFHESTHETLFKSPRANRWVGRLIGLMIAIPYTVYRETHRRHHACLNTAGDYELWPYSDPTTSLGFRRVFVWFDLIFGIVTAPHIYGRIYFSKDPKLKPEARGAIFFEYIATAIFGASIVLGLATFGNANGFDWSQFDPVWLLPMLLSPVVNTIRKFVEHLGLCSEEPLMGTRTIVGGSLLSRALRFLNFDIAVHGPHHRYPKARHFELAPRLQEYLQQNPDQEVPVFRSYSSAVWDTLPYLWKNPATGKGAA